MKDIIQIKKGAQFFIEIEESDSEHIEDLVVFNKGWQKFSPARGAEAGKFTRGNPKDLERLTTEVYRNLTADKLLGIEVAIINNQIQIHAHYE